MTTLTGMTGGNGSANGTRSLARFDQPEGVALDDAGNIYLADYNGCTIRKVTPIGEVTTLAGRAYAPGMADGTGSVARFSCPTGVAIDNAGDVFLADAANNTIRKVAPDGQVTTLAGRAEVSGTADGTGKTARFNWPTGVAVDSAGIVYVADMANNTIRRVTSAGEVTTLAGLAGQAGSADGTGNAAGLNGPYSVAIDGAGNIIVADTYNHTIRRVTPAGEVTTLAGLAGQSGSVDGPGDAARFNLPFGVAVDKAGNIFVADTENHTIRMVTPAGVVTTLAGLTGHHGTEDGTGSIVRFNSLYGIAVDGAGNIYVADSSNNTLRKGLPTSSVATPILQMPSYEAGQIRFSISGPNCLLVDIESSSDFSRWQATSSYILDGGTNYFIRPTQTQGSCFYRAHIR